MLVTALFSIVCVTQAKDPLTPKKYHLQEIHFINTYQNAKQTKGEGRDIYLTLEWRQKSGTHPKQTTDVTITPDKMHLVKSPGIGYYLQEVKATPSSVVIGSPLTGNAFTGSAHAGSNTYFEITSGETLAGSVNNKANITGYKNKDAYDVAHGIIPPVSKKTAKQAVREATPLVGPNPIIAPVTQTKVDKKAARKAARNAATPLVGSNPVVYGAVPVAEVVNNNYYNVPVAHNY